MLGAVLYGAMLVAGSHAGFPEQSPTGSRMPYLADKPIGEDGYYMLNIAWRLAAGDGFTNNSGRATTGIQPLSTMIFAAVAWVVQATGGDRWTFARVMLAVGVLQWLLLAAVMMRLTRMWQPLGSPPIIDAATCALLLTLANYHLFRLSTYGLETPIHLAAVSYFILVWLRGIATMGAAIRLGAAGGIAALARIDFLLMLTLFLAAEIWRTRLDWRRAAAIFASAMMMASPWLLYVYAVTGTPMPSSGRAQLDLPGDLATVWMRTREMLTALAQHVSPWLYLPAPREVLRGWLPDEVMATLVAVAALGVGVWLAWRGWRALEPSHDDALQSWSPALMGLILAYAVAFLSTYFYARYTAPMLLFSIPLMSLGLSQVIRTRALAVAVLAAAIVSFAGVAWSTLHSGQIGNMHSIAAGYVARLLPPPATVGAFQSGTLGYFNPNVVNLDGKVNTQAFEASLAGRLGEYLEWRRVTHLVDWPSLIDAWPEPSFESWPDCGLGRFGASVCRRAPY